MDEQKINEAYRRYIKAERNPQSTRAQEALEQYTRTLPSAEFNEYARRTIAWAERH